eukprot:2050774-Rhodomonas_salina.1
MRMPSAVAMASSAPLPETLLLLGEAENAKARAPFDTPLPPPYPRAPAGGAGAGGLVKTLRRESWQRSRGERLLAASLCSVGAEEVMGGGRVTRHMRTQRSVAHATSPRGPNAQALMGPSCAMLARNAHSSLHSFTDPSVLHEAMVSVSLLHTNRLTPCFFPSPTSCHDTLSASLSTRAVIEPATAALILSRSQNCTAESSPPVMNWLCDAPSCPTTVDSAIEAMRFEWPTRVATHSPLRTS